MPLPGASIIEEKTKKGVITDANGNFEITVENSDAMLLISYIGYKQRRVSANQDNSVIQLFPETTTLQEVVLVGYVDRVAVGLLTRRLCLAKRGNQNEKREPQKKHSIHNG